MKPFDILGCIPCIEMADIPNLAGVATKDLVETIGSGSFKAAYINWSRTLQLLRQNAPGWMVELVKNEQGGVIHQAPVGGFLMIRFAHIDGSVTPAVCQAIMDNRNNAIPYDKITARDVTDTHRRGACMAAAMVFGLAAELWAKMPLESGWGLTDDDQPATSTPKGKTAAKAAKPVEKAAEMGKTDEVTFREKCLTRGLSTTAIDALVEKLNGDFATGVKTLNAKSDEDIAKINALYEEEMY